MVESKIEAVEWRPTGFQGMHGILEEVHAGYEQEGEWLCLWAGDG